MPAAQETRVQSLGGEDPLEKEMATHSSILAWKIPRTEATIHGVTRVRHDLATKPSSDLEKAWFGRKTDLVMIPPLSSSRFVTLSNTLTSSRLNFHNYKMVIIFFALWHCCEKQIRIYREDTKHNICPQILTTTVSLKSFSLALQDVLFPNHNLS